MTDDYNLATAPPSPPKHRSLALVALILAVAGGVLLALFLVPGLRREKSMTVPIVGEQPKTEAPVTKEQKATKAKTIEEYLQRRGYSIGSITTKNEKMINGTLVTYFVATFNTGRDCQSGCIYQSTNGLQIGDDIYSFEVSDPLASPGPGYLGPNGIDLEKANPIIYNPQVWEVTKGALPGFLLDHKKTPSSVLDTISEYPQYYTDSETKGCNQAVESLINHPNASKKLLQKFASVQKSNKSLCNSEQVSLNAEVKLAQDPTTSSEVLDAITNGPLFDKDLGIIDGNVGYCDLFARALVQHPNASKSLLQKLTTIRLLEAEPDDCPEVVRLAKDRLAKL